MVAFCAEHDPHVEPDERLPLPPAGGRGDAGAGDRLRAGHRDRRARRGARLRPGRPRTGFPAVVASISFFVNAGIRFVEEMCKMRAFTAAVGPHQPRALRRHRPEGPPVPLRRAGQLARPHRGPAREQRAAHRARDARRHPVARTPGPGPSSCRRGTRPSACPGPWDQQWSLRMQQVLAYETDLLEYDDLFDGSHVIEAPHRRAGRRGHGRARRRAGPGRRLRGHRRAEGPPGRAPTPSACAASSPAS